MDGYSNWSSDNIIALENFTKWESIEVLNHTKKTHGVVCQVVVKRTPSFNSGILFVGAPSHRQQPSG